MFGESWHVLRKVLTHDTDRALTAYWDRVLAEEQEGQLVSPSAEVSTLAPPKSNPGQVWHICCFGNYAAVGFLLPLFVPKGSVLSHAFNLLACAGGRLLVSLPSRRMVRRTFPACADESTPLRSHPDNRHH